MILVDANVLLYAYDARAEQHERAAAWLEQTMSGTDEIGIASTTAMAFLRITTNARLADPPMSVSTAIAIVASWFDRQNVHRVDPTERHWSMLADVARVGQARGPMLMDAHLATLGLEHGATLATTDRDFSRFRGLRTIDPTIA